MLRDSQEKVRQASVSEVYERQVTQLQGELKTLRDRLRDAEVKANEPSPLLLELQKEMSSMKVSFQTDRCAVWNISNR